MSRLVDIDAIGGEGLRQIAAALEMASPEGRARAALPPEAVAELAEMVVAGKRPTIGWWKRHSAGVIRGESKTRPPSTGSVTQWAAQMVAAGWPELKVAEAVVELAVELGLRQAIAEKACANGIVLGRRKRRARYGQ